MSRQCKLRLGDGTVLAVAPEGLSSWLMDEKAMVQVGGSRRWRPLKLVLAEAREAALQRAAYTPPAPKPDDGSPPVPLRSAEEVLAEARAAALAQRAGGSASPAPPPAKTPAADGTPIEEAESAWPAGVASPLAEAASAPAIPIKLDEPAAEWSAPVASEMDLPLPLPAVVLDDEPIIAFKPIEEPEPVWSGPAAELAEPAAELAQPPAELARPPAEVDDSSAVPPDLFRHDPPVIPFKPPEELEVDWPVAEAPVEAPPPAAEPPPPPPRSDVVHALDPSLEQEIQDELDELDLIEDEPTPVVAVRAPAPPPKPPVPIPPPAAPPAPAPAPPPLVAKPSPPSPPAVRSSAAFTPARAPQPAPVGGLMGRIRKLLGRDRPSLSLFSDDAPTSWAPSSSPSPAPAPVRREPVKPPPKLEELPALRLAPMKAEHAGDLYEEEDHEPRVGFARWAMIACVVAAGLAVVFTYPWWLPMLTSAGQGASSSNESGAGPATGSSPPRGPAVPPVFAEEVQQAAERMPHLSPATIHLIASSNSVAQTLVVPEVFRRGYDAAQRGRQTLPPEELKELGALESAVLSALRPAERERVKAYDRISAGGDLLSEEDERVLSLFARGVRSLSPQRRERLQVLSGKAVAAVLAPGQR